MPTPKLIVLHPGGFVAGDPSWEVPTVTYAQSKGFTCLNLNYPLNDPMATINYAVTAAALAAENGARVYAYGDSAGAGLAARLLQKNAVKAAACYSPVMFFSKWVRSVATHFLDPLRGYTDAQLDLLSPGFFSSVRPMVLAVGVDDCIANPTDALRYAAQQPSVIGWRVDGGHLGATRCLKSDGGPGNPTYDATMHRAINWLAIQAGL